MRSVWSLVWIPVLLGGCGPSTDEAERAALRFVHVAWPGRPVSDGMDRETFGDAAVLALAARIGLERTTVDAAGEDVRAVLRGVGTVVFDGSEAIAVHQGAMPPRSFLAFVRGAQRAAKELRALRGDPAGALRRAAIHAECGRPERALAEVGRAGIDPAAALSIEVDALLSLGDVAAARRAVDAAGPSAARAVNEGRVLVAERRPSEAIAVLRAAEGDEDVRAFWLGRALLDVDARPEAYALLEPLALRDGRWAHEARDLLGAAITGGHGHSHR